MSPNSLTGHCFHLNDPDARGLITLREVCTPLWVSPLNLLELPMASLPKADPWDCQPGL